GAVALVAAVAAPSGAAVAQNPTVTEEAPILVEHPAVADEHAPAQEHSAGMPQLDISTAPSQLFWLAVTFALLYWLLSRKALPRVTDILEARQGRIAADLDRAAEIRADAEQALERYEQMLQEAHASAAAEVRATHER